MIKTGTIALVYTPFRWKNINSYVPALIRMISNVRWSHGGIFVQEESGLFMVEAIYPKVRKIPFANNLEGREFKYYNIQHTFNDQELNERINKYVGAKYDLRSLLIHLPLMIIIKRWFGRKEAKGIESPYCFELIAWIYKMPGWYNIMPQEFVDYVEAHQE